MAAAEQDLRSMWQLPYVCAFCRIFSQVLNLPTFEIEEFELQLYSQDEAFDFFQELLSRLLKGICRRKVDDWNADLLKVVSKYELQGDRYDILEEGGTFLALNAHDRLKVLADLCDVRLTVDDVKDNLSGVPGDNIRYEPIGCDKDGNRYWWFDDTRLYCESVQSKNHGAKKQSAKSSKARGRGKRSAAATPVPEDDDSQGQWLLVCQSEESWSDLASRFKKSRHPDEKELYGNINELMPDILQTIQSRERAEKKRAMYAAMPRRSSGRIAHNKMVEEQKRQEEEERYKQEALLAGLRSSRIAKGHVPTRSERYQHRALDFSHDHSEVDETAPVTVDDNTSSEQLSDDAESLSSMQSPRDEHSETATERADLPSGPSSPPRPPITLRLILSHTSQPTHQVAPANTLEPNAKEFGGVTEVHDQSDPDPIAQEHVGFQPQVGIDPHDHALLQVSSHSEINPHTICALSDAPGQDTSTNSPPKTSTNLCHAHEIS